MNVATIDMSACVIEGVSRSRNALINGISYPTDGKLPVVLNSELSCGFFLVLQRDVVYFNILFLILFFIAIACFINLVRNSGL